MKRVFCDPPDYRHLGKSQHRVAVLAALSKLPHKQLAVALAGKPSRVWTELARFGVRVDRAEATKLLEQIGAEPSATKKLGQCSARLLHGILSIRLPHSRAEARALVPLMRFAGHSLFPDDIGSWLDMDGIRSYRHGLAGIIRECADALADSPEQGDSLLVECLLGTRDLRIPKWCESLFRPNFRPIEPLSCDVSHLCVVDYGVSVLCRM